MLGIFGLFLQAAAGHILYLALHLESGSFPRPLPPDRERAAFADLQKGGAAAAVPPLVFLRAAGKTGTIKKSARCGRNK